MDNLSKLEAWQFQPDADTPGLYIQCADEAQRAAVIKALNEIEALRQSAQHWARTAEHWMNRSDSIAAWYRSCLDVVRIELERGKPLSALQVVLNVLDGSDGPPR
jgi:hypothetical protein